MSVLVRNIRNMVIKSFNTLAKFCIEVQYCAKVMQTIINEYREYRDISAIFNVIFTLNDISKDISLELLFYFSARYRVALRDIVSCQRYIVSALWYIISASQYIVSALRYIIFA